MSDPDRERGGEEPVTTPAQVAAKAVQALVDEPMLWPLAIVIIGHVAAFVSPVLLLAVRDRSVFAIAAMLGLLAVSAQAVVGELRSRRRAGPVTILLGGSWALSTTAAWLANAYDLL